MSTLTDALNRILNWLHQQRDEDPDIAKKNWWPFSDVPDPPHLEPGLSRSEIAEITKDLPVPLPQEVIELYQWSNGSRDRQYNYEFDDWLFDVGWGWGFFMGMSLLPLQSAVDEYQKKISFRREIVWQYQQLKEYIPDLTLCLFEGRECKDGYITIWENKEVCPVIFWNFKGGADEVISKYSSLTQMMLTIAETYEEAYYIQSDGFFGKDENKASEIWRKYNAEYWVEFTLEKIQTVEALLPQMSANNGVKIIYEIGDVLKLSGDARLIPPLIRVLRRPPMQTLEDENLDYLRSQATMVLGWLGGSDTVDPLIPALSDRYWLSRYWASITLGELQDERGISALRERLEDEDERVREAAINALEKIRNQHLQSDPFIYHPGVANMEAAYQLQGINLGEMIDPHNPTAESSHQFEENEEMENDDLPF